MSAGEQATGTWVALRQRKLVQWALAYVAAAWVLLQVLGLSVDSYDWPGWVMRLAIGIAVVGFLVTLVPAWTYGERENSRSLRAASAGPRTWTNSACPTSAARRPAATTSVTEPRPCP